jgi:hypothetical protein
MVIALLNLLVKQEVLGMEIHVHQFLVLLEHIGTELSVEDQMVTVQQELSMMELDVFATIII